MRSLIVALTAIVVHLSTSASWCMAFGVSSKQGSKQMTKMTLIQEEPASIGAFDPEAEGAHDVGNNVSTSRRRYLLGYLIASVGMVDLSGLPAHAVKPRNEALCNTGLFENFLEYRCTPIGNIEDEGQSRAMSSQEQAATDSLLSKLSLGLDSDGTNSNTEKYLKETERSGSEESVKESKIQN